MLDLLVNFGAVVICYVLGYRKGVRPTPLVAIDCHCGHKINYHKTNLLRGRFQGKCTAAVGNKRCACEGYLPKPTEVTL